jgi:hypothetical protein
MEYGYDMICIVELLYLISCLVNTEILLRNVNNFLEPKINILPSTIMFLLC